MICQTRKVTFQTDPRESYCPCTSVVASGFPDDAEELRASESEFVSYQIKY